MNLTTMTVLTSQQTADVIRMHAEESGKTDAELAGLLLTLAVGDVYEVLQDGCSERQSAGTNDRHLSSQDDGG